MLEGHKLPSQNVIGRWYVRHKFMRGYVKAIAPWNIPKASGLRHLCITRVFADRERAYDYGNLVGGCKPLVDALVALEVLIDDSPDWVIDSYEQERGDTREIRLCVFDAT